MPKQFKSEANSTTGLSIALYWIGVLAFVMCIVLTLAGNTDLAWQVEHTGLPLSWMLGLIAIAAFLGAEFTDSAPDTRCEVELAAEVIQQEA